MVARKSYPPFVKTLVSVAVASLFLVNSSGAWAGEQVSIVNGTSKPLDKSALSLSSSPENPIKNTIYLKNRIETKSGSKNTGKGGAIHNGGFDFDLANVEFLSNSANDSGGAIYVNGGEGEFSSVTFVGNNSEYYNGGGGAVIFASSSDFVFSNNTFKNNTAVALGGAVYIAKPKSNVKSSIRIEGETLFEGNSADKGGAIYSEAPPQNKYSLILSGTNNFKDNVAKAGGGAIYNQSGAVILLEDDSLNTFEGNISQTRGGGAINNRGTIELRGTTKFLNNVSTKWSNMGVDYRGGAINNEAGATLNFYGVSIFSKNYDNAQITQNVDSVDYQSVLNSGTTISVQKPTFNIDFTDAARNDIHNDGTINVHNGAVVVMDGGVSKRRIVRTNCYSLPLFLTTGVIYVC